MPTARKRLTNFWGKGEEGVFDGRVPWSSACPGVIFPRARPLPAAHVQFQSAGSRHLVVQSGHRCPADTDRLGQSLLDREHTGHASSRVQACPVQRFRYNGQSVRRRE
ncbi:hypothetical protein RRG08_047397 [Elysia crispata]|uniref:Uncharacterized protein n=1 Tax=Elysia crispata TaxID=231223 RepID=A0AAE0YUW1_9GAST|nr:hypothetical protein RRG08_047397 [Elysia crispata]